MSFVVGVAGGVDDLTDDDQAAGVREIVDATIRRLEDDDIQTIGVVAGAALYGAENAHVGMEDWLTNAVAVYLDTFPCLDVATIGFSHGGVTVAALASRLEEVNLGDRIVAHLSQGQIAPASELNLTKAVQVDARLQETLYLVLEANHAQTTSAIAAANAGMRAGFLLIGAGGVLALLAGLVIAAMVIRIVTRTEARLEREKELAEVTLHSIVDGVITTDDEFRVEYLNPVADRFLGWRGAEAAGRHVSEIFRIVDERTGQPVELLPLADPPALRDSDQRQIPLPR